MDVALHGLGAHSITYPIISQGTLFTRGIYISNLFFPQNTGVGKNPKKKKKTTMFMGGLLHAVLSFAFVAALSYGYGTMFALFVGVTMNMLGALCFFPVLYRVYTSNLVGYHLLRNIMHPRQERPHSLCQEWSGHVQGMQVLPIPVLVDNYCYLIWCESTQEAAVVDPADPGVVYNAILAHNPPLKLTTIIATHKHWDHSGGNQELAAIVKERENGRILRVVGSAIDAPHSMTDAVGEGDKICIGDLSVSFKMVPGHTKGHILTLVEGSDGGVAAFTGDSLFCCGVGVFFEASDVADLHKTHSVYHSLPPACYVFPGHEYSQMLANQACAVDPHNAAASICAKHFAQARRARLCTVPSTMEVEIAANPFLRIPREKMLACTTADQVQNAMYSRA